MPTCYRHPDRETYIRCQRCDRPICPDCMRDAAVGFQCPRCISEGAKSTRSGRTAFGGVRSGNPMTTSLVLIGINLAVWLAILGTGGDRSRLADRLALLVRGRCDTGNGQYYPNIHTAQACATAPDPTWVPGVSDGAYWQLITNAFAHVEIWHIAFNMLALWFLGPQLEAMIGRARFLALYFLSALAGSATVYWLSSGSGSTLGASGAVFGLMGALLVVAVKVGGNVQQIMGWLLINAVFTFTVPSISWQGHLGGFVGGCAIAAVLAWAPRGPRRTTWQVAGLVGIGVVLVVAVLARTATL